MESQLLEIMMEAMELSEEYSRMKPGELGGLIKKATMGKRPAMLKTILDLEGKIAQFRLAVSKETLQWEMTKAEAAKVEETRKAGKAETEKAEETTETPKAEKAAKAKTAKAKAAKAAETTETTETTETPTTSTESEMPKRGRTRKIVPGAVSAEATPLPTVAELALAPLAAPTLAPLAPTLAPLAAPTLAPLAAPTLAPLAESQDPGMGEPLHARRKKIPKHIRTLVWNQYMNSKMMEGVCMCCNTIEIKMTNFHCGHVIAESKGGTLEMSNLRPICAECNTSMGTQSMNEFTKTFFGREI